MARAVSCGVLLVNRHDEVFACHSTGSPRWDLPKGVCDPGEAPRGAAVREAGEEAGLRVRGDRRADLGEFDYLPAKRLHLFALRVADDSFALSGCSCRSFYPHHRTRAATPETDAWGWKPRVQVPAWCGKNMARVLASLDAAELAALPELARIEVDVSSPRTAC
ncbi:MAG: NUDIX hydrolase [Caulobacter sp.]|nr:NUDIX hydrolase [Vitreoscilla sp.]